MDAGTEYAVAEARKRTPYARPLHRTQFGGLTRKLKGRTFGKWVRMSNGRQKYIPAEG